MVYTGAARSKLVTTEAKRWHPEGDADEGVYSRVHEQGLQEDCTPFRRKVCSPQCGEQFSSKPVQVLQCNDDTFETRNVSLAYLRMHFDITFTSGRDS